MVAWLHVGCGRASAIIDHAQNVILQGARWPQCAGHGGDGCHERVHGARRVPYRVSARCAHYTGKDECIYGGVTTSACGEPGPQGQAGEGYHTRGHNGPFSSNNDPFSRTASYTGSIMTHLAVTIAIMTRLAVPDQA